MGRLTLGWCIRAKFWQGRGRGHAETSYSAQSSERGPDAERGRHQGDARFDPGRAGRLLKIEVLEGVVIRPRDAKTAERLRVAARAGVFLFVNGGLCSLHRGHTNLSSAVSIQVVVQCCGSNARQMNADCDSRKRINPPANLVQCQGPGTHRSFSETIG